MEEIPNNISHENLLLDFDVTKKDFGKFFSNLMEPEQKIYEQLSSLSNYKLVEISESDTNIAMEEKPFKDISSYIQEILVFIVNNLSEKLDVIVKNFSPTVLDDLFEILINLWIQKNREEVRLYFLSLDQIYDVFYVSGLRIISSDAIDKLTGALQWDIISPNWLNYNFLFDYQYLIK